MPTNRFHPNHETRKQALRKIVLPVIIAILTAAWHLTTFIPSIWHPDAPSFIGGGLAWARGDVSLPVHNILSYVGWERSLALLPAFKEPPFDPLRIILSAKLAGIFFMTAAAVGQYLLARRLFGSTVFALLATALFATNPYVWLSGNGALSDLPALSIMIFSFLFFIKFFQDRKVLDLVIASLILGIAIVFRIQSVIILPAYFAGILFLAFEETGRSVTDRLKIIVKLGAIACVFPLVFFLAIFGMPWEIVSNTPLAPPTFGYLLSIVKTYVMRDIGWVWFLLASAGFAAGLSRRKTRPIAVMIIACIAAGASYFIPSNLWTAPETPRYLILTIPFTVIGLGFIWTGGLKRTARWSISLFAVAYVASIFVGLRTPTPSGTTEPSWAKKLLTMQHFLAQDAARTYSEALPVMMDGIALGAVLPDGAAVVMPEANMTARYMMREESRPLKRIVIKPSAPASMRYLELVSIPYGQPVFVFRDLEETPVMTVLMDRGFTPRGKVGGTIHLATPDSDSSP